MSVQAYDPYVSKQVAGKSGIKLASLSELLKKSDFITLHTPLTAETRHLIGAAEFRVMKPSALLVNTARGEIVKPRALISALSSGRIAGAAADVFEHEPAAQDDELIEYARTHSNLLVTPHLGAFTVEAISAASMYVAKRVVEALTEKYVARKKSHVPSPLWHPRN